MNDEITYTEVELTHNKAISLNDFLEEYEQKYVRSWRIPEKFRAFYSKSLLTYNEWVKLFIMWIPGEIQI